MMTGDGGCIGSKHGISFKGKWVWGLKDFIDRSFIDLFDPKLLFKDFKKEGTKHPVEDALVKKDFKEMIEQLKERASEMGPEEAAALLGCN